MEPNSGRPVRTTRVRRGRWGLGAATAAVLLAAQLGTAGSAAALAPGTTLDQSNAATPTDLWAITPNQALAQTFTAGLSGSLTDVDAEAFRYDGAADLTVEIRDVVDGLPGPTVLASASVAGADVPGFGENWLTISFDQPAQITAGTQYALVLSTSGTTVYGWYADGTDPYPGGGTAYSGAAIPWTLAEGYDAEFTTYVNPVGIAALVGQLGAAGLPRGLNTSLSSKLRAAQSDLDSGDMAGACRTLRAFGAEVSGLSHRRLGSDTATALTATAASVASGLGCTG